MITKSGKEMAFDSCPEMRMLAVGAILTGKIDLDVAARKWEMPRYKMCNAIREFGNFYMKKPDLFEDEMIEQLRFYVEMYLKKRKRVPEKIVRALSLQGYGKEPVDSEEYVSEDEECESY